MRSSNARLHIDRRLPWWAGLRLVVAGPLLIALMSECGCAGPQDGSPPGSRGNGTEARTSVEELDRGGGGSVFERPLRRLSVEFKVHRYTGPLGAFSSEEGLWRCVTGPLTDSATALRLGDNGFRGAIGRESDRPRLREYLGGIVGLRSALDFARPDASRRVELDLGPCRQREVVFYYDRTGELRGRDFYNARMKLRLTFELRSVNLRDTLLEIVPVIEEPPGPLKWVVRDGRAMQVPEQRVCVFEDLAFAAKVPDGGFLLLGPMGGVSDRPLIGRPFFVRQLEASAGSDVELRESIYVISPMIRSYVEERRKAVPDR